MKKRKILYLFPLTALLLSGCSWAEFKDSVKQSWVGQHIFSPIINWINGGDSGKEEQPSGGETDVTVRSIIIESYKEQVPQGYKYKTSDVSIKVYYSDGTEATKEPESVKCDTSKLGETTLTVTYKGAVKEATVTVLDESEIVHVESIRWEVAKRTLHVGETTQITVTFDPVDATDQSLTFASSDDAILTVSSSGLVEGIAVGSATVTITPNDNPTAKKDVTFTVAAEAAGLPDATQRGYTKLSANETLKNGEKINVAGAIGDVYYVMPPYSSGNNIKGVVVNLEDEKLVIAEDQEFTVVDAGEGKIALMQADGKFLSAAGGSKNNYLKVVDTIDETAMFSVSVDEAGNAQLRADAVNRGYLCLNPNTQYGNPLFGCYSSPDNYEKYAIYHDGNGSTDVVPVESIAFAQEEYSIEQGSSVDVLATVGPTLATDKGVIYEILSAEPEGCITLEGRTVTGNEVGEAVIIAKSHENEEITATAAIHVTEYVERNYGTLEEPLTINQAKTVIDLDGGTSKETIYVKGSVSKNDAYSTKYNNTNIWLTDGVNEFELYGALLPEGFEPAQPAANDAALVGKTVVAHGMGKIYNGTYEFDKNCQVDSVTDEELPPVTVTGLIEGSATGIPETIEQGDSLKVENINVGVYMSDGSEGVTHPDSIELSTEALGLVGGKLIVGEFEYEFTITVVEAVERDYGTLEDPLTVSEALALITETCPNNNNVTEQEIYCIGTVSEKGTDKGSYYQNVKVSDGESEILIYSLNLTEEQEALFDVGKVIKFHGYAKNYNGTLEFATYTDSESVKHFVSVDEVIVEVVPVQGLSLSAEELNMEVGLPDETLTVTFDPENATNKEVAWESSNPEVATVEGGVVHAVAAGDAVITATSAENENATDSCTVHVTVPEAQLVGIEVTTMPKVEYTEGDFLDLSEMVVTLHYDDESTKEITAGWTTNISAENPLTTEDTSLVVSFGGFSADPIALTITAKPQPVHAGTAEDPYTISDCEIVYANANLEQGKDIGAEVYVAGTILADPAATISGGRGRLYIGDSSSQNSLYIYNINNIGGSNNLTLADIPAGSEVVAKGTLKNYNGMQLCYVSNVANCEFISIEKPFVAPETVTITSGSELGVGSNMNLAATVGPEGAAQDVEWTIVTGGEYATLSDGVLTGVAAGEVTVRATAVGYESVYAEKTISVSSSVAPTEQIIYTLDATDTTQGSNGYATVSEITQGGVSWDVVANTTINPWRFGGKNLDDVDRTATCKSAFSDDITKVVVTTGSKTVSALNSIKLLVGSSEGASDVDSIALTDNLVNASLEFARPEGHSWANCYFTIVFNVDAGGSNQYIQLTAVNFYAVK